LVCGVLRVEDRPQIISHLKHTTIAVIGRARRFRRER
jgi:hypothetical protein